MANTKEFDGEYEEADSIENPGVGVRWIYARRTDKLAALALEFGFSADGTVAETQKALATLVSTGLFPESVWKRLAQLQEQYSSRAVTPNRLGGDKGFMPEAKMTKVSQSPVFRRLHLPRKTGKPSRSSSRHVTGFHRPIPRKSRRVETARVRSSTHHHSRPTFASRADAQMESTIRRSVRPADLDRRTEGENRK